MSDFLNKIQPEMNPSGITKKESAFWQRLEVTVAKMSQEQVKWTSEQKDVSDSKELVMSAFIDFLFMKERDSFITYGEGIYAPLAEDYINVFQQTSKKFVSEADRIKNENKQLEESLRSEKKQREELEKQLAALKKGKE